VNLLDSINISATGLSAQRIRLNIASMNLANANVTRTVDGGPYRAKSVIFSSEKYKPESAPVTGTGRPGFEQELEKAVETVKVTGIVEDPDPFIQVYDPTHPDADANGMVSYPNVNTMEQMVDVMNASRAYEANATVLETAKSMAMKALELAMFYPFTPGSFRITVEKCFLQSSYPLTTLVP